MNRKKSYLEMKNYIEVVCVCLVALCPIASVARELLVKTVDAFTGLPVPGITVKVKFLDEQAPVVFTRTSDDKGEFRLKRRAFRDVSFFVAITERNYCTTNYDTKRFEGRADVEAVVPVALKGKPAKLRIAEVKRDFPKDSDEMRFDFLLGDWLPPVGTGEVADVVFRRMPQTCLGMSSAEGGRTPRRRMKDALLVRYPGEGNGIQVVPTLPQCQLWVRTAPESGYSQEYESFSMDGENMEPIGSTDPKKALCFRIRTQKDDGGSVTNCCYGKIYGEFDWTCDYYNAPHVQDVKFLYYLNETPMDRNLEKDPDDVSLYRFRP